MGITWNGVQYSHELPKFIYDTTGVWPSTTGISRVSTNVTSTTLVTLLDLSSGPYILLGFRVDPNGNDNGLYLKATVDGTAVIPEAFYSGYTVGLNHAVGQYFDDASAAPILCRSSLKLEAKYHAFYGTDYAEYMYMSYSLS